MSAEFEILCESWGKGEISLREAANRLGVSHMTFYM